MDFDEIDIVMMTDSKLSESVDRLLDIKEINPDVPMEKICKEANIDLGFDPDIEDEIDEVEYDKEQDDALDPLDQDAEDYRQSRDDYGPIEDDSDGEMIDNMMVDDMDEAMEEDDDIADNDEEDE